MDKDPTSNGTTAPPPVAGALGRLLLGGLAVGEQILTIPVERSEQVAAAPGTLPPPSARHLVIGALLHGRAGLARARRRVLPMAAVAARWASRFSSSRRLLERTRRTLAGWSRTGQREEAEARLLTMAVGQDFIRVALAVIADSPEVRSVVHEQSSGLTRSALADLRDRSAHADTIAAAVSGKVLGGRGPRE
jgi:hypothetical protein